MSGKFPFKLPDVIVTNKEESTNYIYTKALKRLFFLRRPLNADLNTRDLLLFYKTIIGPVIKYACLVWHKFLTQSDASKMERIQ